MNKSHEVVLSIVAQLGESLREEYEERAGILEFDAKLSRNHAECLALLMVLQSHPEALAAMMTHPGREAAEGHPSYKKGKPFTQ